jgi:beta-N-acetylhexosaminidase
MGATPTRILLRRGLAAAVVIGLGAAGWWLLVRDDAGSGTSERERGRTAKAPQSGPAAGMPVEDLADQVLLLGFDGTDASAPIVAELGSRELGGVLVEQRNWVDSASGTALIAELSATGATGDRVPPLIVGTQEGGSYRSYPDLPPSQSALEMGDQDDPGRVEAWARETAAALSQAGFHLNLFPVADVATLDSPVADRAFSDDPGTVAVLTDAAVRGCRDAGLGCAPLHFPGLGGASQDTAAGPATVSVDAGTLAARDLEPFRAAVEARVPAVVLSLALYAAHDPITPGALTPAVATGLLRDELGFEGVAITDDLSSGAVKATYRVPDAAVAALAAGADLIQVSRPEDQGRVREAIVAAAESGELDPARLAEAAERVLELKRSLGLTPQA